MGRNPPKKSCVVHSTGKPKKAIAASGFYLKEVFSERRMFYEGKNMGAIAKKINDEFKILPPEVRLPYEKLAEADLARYWAEMAHVEKKNYKIATRSSIKNVKEINDSLTDEQREAIKRVGFGSMLDIDLGNLRHSICLWIAETFNGSSNSFNFHGERYPFNPDDVESMIGLKNTGERIVLRESNDEDYLRVKASFGPNNVISFTKLSSKLRENHSADDDFVRSYLMNMFAYFLFPNTDAGIKAYYLQPLIHVDSIASYNWAQHVFKLLRAGMIEYNCRRIQLEKITETESKRVTITFRGCMSLLMILFLDQINGPNDFNREHYEVPSIMYWNVDNIKNKVRRVGVLYQYQESCNVIPKFYDYPPDYKLVDDEKPLKKKVKKEKFVKMEKTEYMEDLDMENLDKKDNEQKLVNEERIKKIEKDIARVVEFIAASECAKDITGNEVLDGLKKLTERVDVLQASFNYKSQRDPTVHVQVGVGVGISHCSRPCVDNNQNYLVISDDEGVQETVVLEPHKLCDAKILMNDDQALVNYLLVGPPDERVVDYVVNHVTRTHMRHLLIEETMVDEEIIGAMAHALNYEERKYVQRRYFCPTSLWQMGQRVDRNGDFRRQYWLNNKFEGDFNTLQQIFIPYNRNLHWGLVVIDLRFKKIYRWDTMLSQIRPGIFKDELTNMLLILHEQFKVHPSYKKDITTFERFVPEWVPEQSPYGNDCAVYVCELMRIREKTTEWTDAMSGAIRFSVASYIWRHDINQLNTYVCLPVYD